MYEHTEVNVPKLIEAKSPGMIQAAKRNLVSFNVIVHHFSLTNFKNKAIFKTGGRKSLVLEVSDVVEVYIPSLN